MIKKSLKGLKLDELSKHKDIVLKHSINMQIYIMYKVSVDSFIVIVVLLIVLSKNCLVTKNSIPTPTDYTY